MLARFWESESVDDNVGGGDHWTRPGQDRISTLNQICNNLIRIGYMEVAGASLALVVCFGLKLKSLLLCPVMHGPAAAAVAVAGQSPFRIHADIHSSDAGGNQKTMKTSPTTTKERWSGRIRKQRVEKCYSIFTRLLDCYSIKTHVLIRQKVPLFFTLDFTQRLTDSVMRAMQAMVGSVRSVNNLEFAS